MAAEQTSAVDAAVQHLTTQTQVAQKILGSAKFSEDQKRLVQEMLSKATHELERFTRERKLSDRLKGMVSVARERVAAVEKEANNRPVIEAQLKLEIEQMKSKLHRAECNANSYREKIQLLSTEKRILNDEIATTRRQLDADKQDVLRMRSVMDKQLQQFDQLWLNSPRRRERDERSDIIQQLQESVRVLEEKDQKITDQMNKVHEDLKNIRSTTLKQYVIQLAKNWGKLLVMRDKVKEREEERRRQEEETVRTSRPNPGSQDPLNFLDMSLDVSYAVPMIRRISSNEREVPSRDEHNSAPPFSTPAETAQAKLSVVEQYVEQQSESVHNSQPILNVEPEANEEQQEDYLEEPENVEENVDQEYRETQEVVDEMSENNDAASEIVEEAEMSMQDEEENVADQSQAESGVESQISSHTPIPFSLPPAVSLEQTPKPSNKSPSPAIPARSSPQIAQTPIVQHVEKSTPNTPAPTPISPQIPLKSTPTNPAASPKDSFFAGLGSSNPSQSLEELFGGIGNEPVGVDAVLNMSSHSQANDFLSMMKGTPNDKQATGGGTGDGFGDFSFSMFGAAGGDGGSGGGTDNGFDFDFGAGGSTSGGDSNAFTFNFDTPGDNGKGPDFFEFS